VVRQEDRDPPWLLATLSAEGLLRRSCSPIAVIVTLGVIIFLAGCVQSSSPAMPAMDVLPSRAAPLKTFSQWLDEKQVNGMTNTQWAAIARHSSIVVLNSWSFRLIPILKRANPDVSVWVYKNLSGVRSDDCTTSQGTCRDCRRGITDSQFLSSGMGYCWVKSHHPRWFLRSSLTGWPFEFQHYPHIWATDYGSNAYQRRWVRNVLADVRAHGWDGVEVDNALTTADAYGIAAKYRSDATVQAATYSALRTIGEFLRKAGVASVFNVGYATRFPGLWQRWLGPAAGLEQEFYLALSAGSRATGAAWRVYEQEISSCAAEHKSCWFKPSNARVSGTSPYALASYLLAASGQQFLGVANMPPLRRPCWQLGAPEGPRQQIGPAWRRFFRWGVAVVNPTSKPLTVSVGGFYTDQRGHAVATVTLKPASGAVLPAVHSGPAGMTPSGEPRHALC
jgi:hypothetical protein